MIISKLPPEIQNRVIECQKSHGNHPNTELDLMLNPNEGNFSWGGSDEGHAFWSEINNGNYSSFYIKYPDSTKELEERKAKERIKKFEEKVAREEARRKKLEEEENELFKFLNS